VWETQSAMRTTLELPDDLAAEVRRRAAADGRGLEDEVVELVRQALGTAPESLPLPQPTISTDPQTGLPVIISAPDAPISRMGSGEFLDLIRKVEEEDDLVRFARSLGR
jgi:plasmid stability protein